MNRSTSQMSSTLQYFTGADWLDLHFLAMQPEYEEMVQWVGFEPGWCVLDAALPPDELEAWHRLVQAGAEQRIVNDPDFQFRVVQTVFVGQVP